MARVVVIGANGFIGSHLVDALAAAGHAVSAFDRFSSDEPTFSTPGVRIIRGEFLNRSDLETAVSGQDYVFHFLSTTSPATAEDDPTLDLHTNVVQTVELLQLCVSHSVERFFFSSTGGAMYGDQCKQQYSELDRALPISPYGIGKLAIERYLRYFDAKHGLKSTALRISNPYGTRQHPNKRQGLIPIALRQIALGQPVERMGDGSMVRDFIFVEDVVRAIVTMVGKESRFDVYNIGSGIGLSVNEVLQVLGEVTQQELSISERLIPPTYVERVVLDVARYSEEFGAIALTPLHEGATETFEEIRARLG